MIVAAAEGNGTPDDTPDDGALRIGSTVDLAHVDQSRDSLDGSRTVYEEITDGQDVLIVGNREVNGRAYCASFNFKGSDQQKKVGDLSGGERNRVHLAKLLRRGGNVLLLDEPTNDLDVDTLRALEDALDSFPGCAVVITPRPMVPRPHRHPHPGLRGRLPGALVRGQLQRVRGVPQGDPGRRRGAAPPHQVQAPHPVGATPVQPRIVRRLVLVVFVGGIAGMIVGSIADNNGTAITFGLITAVAAVCLILVTSVSSTAETVHFDEVRAEEMESRIQALVAAGAEEATVRDLVRDAVVLGRSARAEPDPGRTMPAPDA